MKNHSTNGRRISAVGYARRSTDLQDRSIPDQKAYIEKWAKENGYKIIRWYVDDAISGTSELADRQLVESYVERIEIDPKEKTGVLYVRADLQDALLSSSTRGPIGDSMGTCVERVAFGWERGNVGQL